MKKVKYEGEFEEVICSKTVKKLNKTCGYVEVPLKHYGKGVDIIIKKLDIW